MNKKEKIIFTVGGSGFIGRHLITNLLENDYFVTNIDPISLNNNNPKYKHISLPVNDNFKSVKNIIPSGSVIYYLASSSVPGREKSFFNDYNDTVKPFIDFLEAVKLLTPRIIYLSSAGAIYGENNKPALESDILKPKSIYGIHKLLIERYLFNYQIDNHIDYRIARISNPYGNNLIHGHGVGFVDMIARNFKSKQPIKIFADLNNQRDFIHINDVIDALILISNFSLIPDNKTVNISFGKSYSLKKVIHLFEEKYNYELKLIREGNRNSDITNSLVDSNLLKRTYGYIPKYCLENYIRDMI